MATVNSVLGPLDTTDLGFVLPHEHVVVSSAGVRQTYPELYGDLDRLAEQAALTLVEARDGGVRTIVDLSTLDLGRDVRFLADLSQRTGVQIVAATGVWRDIPRALWERGPDELAALFVRELTVGIDGTDIKAGIVKVANDAEGVTKEGEAVLRAAARAASQTGARIATHSYAPGRVGDRQVAIFEDEGFDLNRVSIGHSNDTTDLDYLEGLLAKGVWLGLDRHQTARPIGPDWEARTETLAALIRAGHGDRLLVSHDWSVLSVHRTADPLASRANNPHGWLFATRVVFPRLRELGIAEAQIAALNVANPRRFFGG